YLEVAEQAEAQLAEGPEGAWLDRLAVEHDNLRAAINWAAESHDTALGLRLGVALWRFWFARGHLTEARAPLHAILAAAPDPSPSTPRARALNALGNVVAAHGEYDAARAHYRQSLADRRLLGDHRGVADSLNNLGTLAYRQGDHAQARSLHEES